MHGLINLHTNKCINDVIMHFKPLKYVYGEWLIYQVSYALSNQYSTYKIQW